MERLTRHAGHTMQEFSAGCAVGPSAQLSQRGIRAAGDQVGLDVVQIVGRMVSRRPIPIEIVSLLRSSGVQLPGCASARRQSLSHVVRRGPDNCLPEEIRREMEKYEQTRRMPLEPGDLTVTMAAKFWSCSRETARSRLDDMTERGLFERFDNVLLGKRSRGLVYRPKQRDGPSQD